MPMQTGNTTFRETYSWMSFWEVLTFLVSQKLLGFNLRSGFWIVKRRFILAMTDLEHITFCFSARAIMPHYWIGIKRQLNCRSPWVDTYRFLTPHCRLKTKSSKHPCYEKKTAIIKVYFVCRRTTWYREYLTKVLSLYIVNNFPPLNSHRHLTEVCIGTYLFSYFWFSNTNS
jgi:hypothetical protein